MANPFYPQNSYFCLSCLSFSLPISAVVIQSSTPPSPLPLETSYRGISRDQRLPAHELRVRLSFTQIRLHCKKQRELSFHITTAANSSGEAIVQYFSGQTDVQPASCGSFFRMENDNSRLAKVWEEWGRENALCVVGKKGP